jgi:hypothetical protein
VPFLLACCIGGWAASTGLRDKADQSAGSALFLIGAFGTVGVACSLVACIRQRTSRGAPIAVLAIAATYAIPMSSHRAGPWSAGVVGAGVLCLAWITQGDLRRRRCLPVASLRSNAWVLAALAAVATTLDVGISTLGGRAGHGELKPLSVVVGGVAACGLIALCAVLAVGNLDQARRRLRRSTTSTGIPQEPVSWDGHRPANEPIGAQPPVPQRRQR